MSESERDQERVQKRAAQLLPEEIEAGSHDPEAQAEAILEDSDARAAGRRSPADKPIEHRRSEEIVEPIAEITDE